MNDSDQTILAAISEWADDKLSDMKQILNKNNKDRGELGKTIDLKVSEKENGKFVVELIMADYGIFVDEGRKPGKQPPLQNIINWCKKKGIPEGAAFPIARSIGRDGIPGIHFTKPLIELRKLIDNIEEEYAKWLENNIADSLNENK